MTVYIMAWLAFAGYVAYVFITRRLVVTIAYNPQRRVHTIVIDVAGATFKVRTDRGTYDWHMNFASRADLFRAVEKHAAFLRQCNYAVEVVRA